MIFFTLSEGGAKYAYQARSKITARICSEKLRFEWKESEGHEL